MAAKEAVIKLFGRPEVSIGGERVRFPFKQAEALLYYLLLRGEATKFVLADIIWESGEDSEKTMSSMRNAIYVLRKIFGKDFLIEPVKNTIKINPAYAMSADAPYFLANDHAPVEIYGGELLEDFYLKNNQMYNDWVDEERRAAREVLQKRLKREAETALQTGKNERCVELCKRMLAADEFDEHAYRALIEAYQAEKEYAKAIALYEKMEKLFAEELFETPASELRRLIEEVKEKQREELSAWIGRKNREKGGRPELSFFGRESETAALREELEAFMAGEAARAVAVTGEGGVGKSYLVRNVLSSCSSGGNPLILSTECFRTEEKYSLKPWYKILKRLLREEEDEEHRRLAGGVSTVYPFIGGEDDKQKDYFVGASYRNVEKTIVDLLLEIAAKRPLILYFDDLQWSDAATISLIRNVMTTDHLNSIFFIITYKGEAALTPDAERFIENMTLAAMMRELPLQRVGFGETVSMMRGLLPGQDFTPDFDRRFYDETGGNPFFIAEMVNQIKDSGSLDGITPNIRDVIKNRIGYLSPECRSILELISIFLGGVSSGVLARLSRKDELELSEIIETLISKQFLREEEHSDEIILLFTHQKIPEYIYNNLSQVKKRILHAKAGACLEEELGGGKEDMLLYPRLIYHFERGAMKTKNLKYRVKYMNSYMTLAHEYFPVVNAEAVKADGSGLEQLSESVGAAMDSTVDEVAKLVREFAAEQESDFLKWEGETHEVISDCLHLIGRHQILNCNYSEGVRSIGRLKELNSALRTKKEAENAEKANKQLLYIHINRGDPKKMLAVTEETLTLLLPKLDDAEKTAVWTRMRGMGRIMSGLLDAGVADLLAAIEVFEKCGDKRKYLYNLAASYAWLGEAKRRAFDYRGAASCYAEAIETMNAFYWAGGGATFFTYAGMCAFDSGDKKVAEANLKNALSRYNKVTLLWGRGLAHAYSALIAAADGADQSAVSHLTLAQKNADKLDSDYERGVIERVRAQLAARMAAGCESRGALATALTEAPQAYAARAQKYLRDVYSPIDEKYLSEIAKQEQPR